MSNRIGGYYRKNGSWVSPDGYGRKRGSGSGNNGGDFYSYVIIAFIVLFFLILSNCSN